jgi:hypothetical protein
MPPARRPDQKAPGTYSPTGVGYEGPREGRDPREQAGDALTTPNGVRIPDSDHSLKAGPRGPVLLEDFHLRAAGQRGPAPGDRVFRQRDRPDPEVVLNFIDAHDFPAGLVLQVLDVPESTDYDWRPGRSRRAAARSTPRCSSRWSRSAVSPARWRWAQP